MAYTITTPPSEPITTAEAKTHLRVTHTDDDTYIDSLVTSARTWIEKQYNIAIGSQTITEYFDDWNIDQLRLSVSGVTSVTSVKYYDTDNALVEDFTTFKEDLISNKARIIVNSAVTTPAVYDRPNAIIVVYVAGDTPTPIVHAMKLMVSDWYLNRERMPGNVRGRLMDTVERLLYPYAYV